MKKKKFFSKVILNHANKNNIKTILKLNFFMLLFATTLQAQLPYNFSMANQPFQYLSNPVIMPGTTQTVTLPFAFTMFGMTNTTAAINITNDGYINFGNYGVVSFAGQMNTQSGSQTSYEVSGSSPSQIFKVEWRGQGLANSPATNDSVTYQIWLDESTNTIEWHFGPNTYYSGSFASNPFVMLNNNGTYYNIYGSPASPQFSQCGLTCHLNGIPVSGKVYILSPPPNGITENSPGYNHLLFPNPSSGKIFLKNYLLQEYEGEAAIYDCQGRLIEKRNLEKDAELNSFEISKSGIYFVITVINGTRNTEKIIIE